MDVRAHMSMLFHLDKCIGCHTCSVACKNLWTDRKGAEYMWWNNVETRPGTGYPTGWEDQEHYRGGWKKTWLGIDLRVHGRTKGLANLFYNPALPELDDYYEPFTFRYEDLFNAPEGEHQPTAIPISMVLPSEPIEIESGPNWDDDLSGSPIYAANDPSLEGVSDEVRQSRWGRSSGSCSTTCPASATTASTRPVSPPVRPGRSTSAARTVWFSSTRTSAVPGACACRPVRTRRSTTTGRPANRRNASCASPAWRPVRRPPVLTPALVGSDTWASCSTTPTSSSGLPKAPKRSLFERQREIILDPFDPAVIDAAKANGIDDGWIDSAQDSPVYKFVKVWNMAVPLHAEYRTISMMYYIPPLSPVVSTIEDGLVRLDIPREQIDFELFNHLEKARLPIQYLANLFSVGNEDVIERILRKMLAVRIYKRRESVEGVIDDATLAMIESADTTPDEIEAIYRLSTLPNHGGAFRVPAVSPGDGGRSDLRRPAGPEG